MKLNTAGVKWIFFDLDGTLVNSVLALFNVYADFLSELGIKYDHTDLQQLNGFSIIEIIHFAKNKYSLVQPHDYLLTLYKQKIRLIYEETVLPMPNATEVLTGLSKSFNLQIVTSGEKADAMRFITKYKWDLLFSDYTFGSEVAKGKPDPEIYNLARKRSGSDSLSVITVEDSPNGVRSSTSAGIQTIGISHNTQAQALTNAGASAVISSLSDLPSIFQNH